MKGKEEYIIREMTVRYKASRRKTPIQLSSPEKVWKFFRGKIGLELQECFVGVFLNEKNHIAAWKVLFRGTVNETMVHPRDVMLHAILANATRIIIVHNHPSGVVTPSQQDIETTKKLQKCAGLFGIDIVDHVIICNDCFLSFGEADLL